MPTHFGRSKVQDFNFLMDRIWAKLKGWKENNLSFEGRGVLIRAVAQAIPTYIMSFFSYYLRVFVRKLKRLCAIFGGATLVQIERYIGYTKTKSSDPSMKEVWDLNPLETLI